MTESWRAVVGYEGSYEVSDCGRVRSLGRVVKQRNWNGIVQYRRVKEMMLKRTPMRAGHLFVRLYRPGGGIKESRTVAVHRLVLIAFAGSCPEGMECCHSDGNPANNHLSNLRWDTYKANSADRKRHGVGQADVCQRGEQRYNAKVTEEVVRVIRAERKRGVKLQELADRFGIKCAAVSHIALKRNWAHVKDE